MWTRSNPLAVKAAALRSGQCDLLEEIRETCDYLDAADPSVQALLSEPGRRERLVAEAHALIRGYPDPVRRPPLYGVLVGIKDLFAVDGFSTRAGSRLPVELFAGPEAACVTRLRAAGALILGKTVTTEFAYFEPGPTRNPRNLEHTPGGSSSGSAAAVAAGFCPLALGTQTIGSAIRPAAFCGIIGFKPSYGRIPTAGLILCAASLDHIGIFTRDVAGLAVVAPLLCDHWQPVVAKGLPVLGVPEGPYLTQATPEALSAFEAQLTTLMEAGYRVRRVAALEDIEAINQRHRRLVFAEMAQVHRYWFAEYESLYRPMTAAALREGQTISAEEATLARNGRAVLRAELTALMARNEIDLWVCPAAPGPAPKGIGSTGVPTMNLPWTHAGLPAITVPAGYDAQGLPLGLQLVSAMLTDESLVAWAQDLADAVVPAPVG